MSKLQYTVTPRASASDAIREKLAQAQAAALKNQKRKTN